MLANKYGEPPVTARFSSIDGLRGFLAFFVFLHHSCIWYFYLHTGKWEVPPSNLYTHFGQSSVALFFMITGFLFFSKLIEGRSKNIDWLRLFISRLLRLLPLYIFVIFLLFAVALTLSKGSLNEPMSTLLVSMLRWATFTLFGSPDLNGISPTGIIIAGVTWSLPYEWVFYISLPLLALTVGVFPPRTYVFLSAVSLMCLPSLPSFHYLSFLGGIAAAFLVRSKSVQRMAVGKLSSLTGLTCLALTVVFFPTSYGLAPLLLLTSFFVLIAAGNSLFGFLVSPASRTLGQFAYGIYLIHGITLFVLFNFGIGLSHSRGLSVVQYWAIVIGITPVLIVICFLIFIFIEHPAMRKTSRVTSRVRSILAGRAKIQTTLKTD